MRRILVSALFLGASGLPALADPLQLLPSAFATHERANAGAAVQAQPQPAGRGMLSPISPNSAAASSSSCSAAPHANP
jgi:hypothetical protein